MSYPGRDEQGSYYPPNGSYQPQMCQNMSPNMVLGMYHDQQSNVHTNHQSVDHLQQMAYMNSQMHPPPMNPQSQQYYYPTPADYTQNSYQNQYSYPPPYQYAYGPGSGYSNYPPPPPPPIQSGPPIDKKPPADQKKYKEEKKPLSVPEAQETQDAPPAPVKREQEPEEEKEIKKPVPIMVGKRRGGRVLPTGVVKKQRTENEGQGRSDAWSQYMAEVRRYKEQSCEEERKNRPLVK